MPQVLSCGIFCLILNNQIQHYFKWLCAVIKINLEFIGVTSIPTVRAGYRISKDSNGQKTTIFNGTIRTSLWLPTYELSGCQPRFARHTEPDGSRIFLPKNTNCVSRMPVMGLVRLKQSAEGCNALFDSNRNMQ